VLIGEPGVGKTAIVEGLAQRIVLAYVPDVLKRSAWWRWIWPLWWPVQNNAASLKDRRKAVLKEITKRKAR